MKNIKHKKKIQKEFAMRNIEHYLNLLDSNFYPEFNSLYIKEIERFSEQFNVRLDRKTKNLFCKKCKTYFNTKNREIRLNSTFKCKEIICKNCGNVKRFPY